MDGLWRCGVHVDHLQKSELRELFSLLSLLSQLVGRNIMGQYLGYCSSSSYYRSSSKMFVQRLAKKAN